MFPPVSHNRQKVSSVLLVAQANGVCEVVPDVEGHPNVGFQCGTLNSPVAGRQEDSRREPLKTHCSTGDVKILCIYLFVRPSKVVR